MDFISIFTKKTNMKTLNIIISDNDFISYAFQSDKITFSEIAEKIKKRTIRKALYKCQSISDSVSLSNLTMEEINQEINEVRKKNAKNNN